MMVTDEWLERYERLTRLIGPDNTDILKGKHVFVAGLGGVGSWAAEAIIRCGIGKITIVDFDTVAPSNTNRQLVAHDQAIGCYKVDILKKRLQLINPKTQLEGIITTISPTNLSELFSPKPDYVIDAIDDVPSKCALIAYCYQHKIDLVTSSGSGGIIDPTKIRVTDLAGIRGDRLGRAVRRCLRDEHNFPDGPYGIKAICSVENYIEPYRFEGETIHRKDLPNGTAVFITGVFGMFCASVVVRDLLGYEIKLGRAANLKSRDSL